MQYDNYFLLKFILYMYNNKLLNKNYSCFRINVDFYITYFLSIPYMKLCKLIKTYLIFFFTLIILYNYIKHCYKLINTYIQKNNITL
jgi:hypothetical protein